MAILQVLKGPNPGHCYTLTDRAVLGRHPDCDIILDVGSVSRQHAQILHEGSDFFVEDLKSRNGTYVNGELVSTRRRLEDNDRLKICDLLFTFHLQAPAKRSVDLRLNATSDAEREAADLSSIMSKVSVAAASGVRVTVNPEMKLRALLEITNSLAKTVRLDDVLPKLLDSLFTIFIQADRGFIVLQMEEDGPLEVKAAKMRRGEIEDPAHCLSRTIVRHVMTTKDAVLSADAARDVRFDSAQSIADFRIRSMICAPLLSSTGRALGVLQLDSLEARSQFRQDDLELLASVASQAAFAIENAQLHEAEIARQALEYDLSLARQVQQGFLPHSAPRIEGYDFFSFYEAAKKVGGDYFDYVSLPEGRLAIVLADVSGKGMPAALLMAKLSAETRYCLAIESSPADAVGRLNATLSSAGLEDRFVTLVLCVLDPKSHQVIVVNAGHMAPYLRNTKGEVCTIGDEITGVPLGVAPDFVYQQAVCTLQPHDTLTIFTDGLSEAMNEENELYGLERLRSQLQRDGFSSMSEVGQGVLADVKQFVGERAQSDDMCLICFGRIE